MKVADQVKNPVEVPAFLDGMMEDGPDVRKVKAIYIRDMTTEEKGYTKSVDESNDPTAIVYLDGDCTSYRLAELDLA